MEIEAIIPSIADPHIPNNLGEDYEKAGRNDQPPLIFEEYGEENVRLVRYN